MSKSTFGADARRGSAGFGQCYDQLIFRGGGLKITAVCVWGGAALARGYEPSALDILDTYNLYHLYPELEGSANHACPASDCCSEKNVANMAAHLNDYHRWPIARIADWVDSLNIEAS